jgi:hypothetical protein
MQNKALKKAKKKYQLSTFLVILDKKTNFMHDYKVIFFWRKYIPEHLVTVNSAREVEVLFILMPGKKDPEHHSGLCPSEKELLEQCSCAYRHKNTPDYTYTYNYSYFHFLHSASSYVYTWFCHFLTTSQQHLMFVLVLSIYPNTNPELLCNSNKSNVKIRWSAENAVHVCTI